MYVPSYNVYTCRWVLSILIIGLTLIKINFKNILQTTWKCGILVVSYVRHMYICSALTRKVSIALNNPGFEKDQSQLSWLKWKWDIFNPVCLSLSAPGTLALIVFRYISWLLTAPKQGCQIFLGSTYQNWEKHIKWAQNIPNGCTAVKYSEK
jgi:hypothetical protein